MENGLYPLTKLKVILLHLLQIKSGNQQIDQVIPKEDPYNQKENDDKEPLTESNEELVIDFLVKFWNKALLSWVPIKHYYDIAKWITDFLLRKTLLTKDKKLQDYCITKMADFIVDSLNEKLVVNWLLHFDFDILVPTTPAENVPVGESYQLDDLVPIYLKMTIHHKYFLLKKLCSSHNISDLEKEMMM